MPNVSILNTTSQVSGKTLCVAENTQTVSGAWTFSGNQTFNGNVAIGNAASDTLTITSTIVSSLLFTDATYDIGASGATRPRDFFLSRNAVIGGTLAVTGVATFTAAPVISAGLSFPATQAPSAGVNVLDDYEEGTWTPTDNSGAALSFTSVTAQYVKIGQMVFCSYNLTYPTTSDGSNASIAGLPFTAQSISGWGGIQFRAASTTAHNIEVSGGATTARWLGESGGLLSNASLSTLQLYGTFIYRASA